MASRLEFHHIFHAVANARAQEVTHEFRHFSVRHAAVSGKAEHEDFARIDGGNLVFDACTAVLATGRALSATDDPEVAQECFQRGVAPPPTAVGGSAESAAPAPASSKPLPLPTKLPMSVEHVTALCAVSLAMTVDEYLAEFDSPVQYTLESELTWPMEPFIKY